MGPDMPITHLMLYFPKLMEMLCRKKFKHFGKGAEFRPGAYATACSKISIGDRVIIKPETKLFADEGGAEIIIEDNVLIAYGVHFYCNNHLFENKDLPIIDQSISPSRPIVLKTGCWIGANVIILPGITVGRNAVVGAGSILTKDVPDRVVVVGNPAKIIRRLG